MISSFIKILSWTFSINKGISVRINHFFPVFTVYMPIFPLWTLTFLSHENKCIRNHTLHVQKLSFENRWICGVLSVSKKIVQKNLFIHSVLRCLPFHRSQTTREKKPYLKKNRTVPIGNSERKSILPTLIVRMWQKRQTPRCSRTMMKPNQTTKKEEKNNESDVNCNQWNLWCNETSLFICVYIVSGSYRSMCTAARRQK